MVKNKDWYSMNYVFHILVLINIYLILTVSTNLMVGLSNLLSIGQGAFYGIGAYITALALKTLGLAFFPSILLAVGITLLFAIIIGYISLKLEGDYFVLATLGTQIIVYTILYNWIEVTKGPYGIPGIPSPRLFGFFELKGIIPFLIVSSVLSFLTTIIFHRLINSPFGRELKGLRDDSISMLALGKNITKLKIQSFVLSSSFAALSGFIYASYITYIDPTSFNLDESIFILSAVLIGGTGNIKGPVLGAIFVVVLPELLRFTGLPDNVAANLKMIIYGVVIILGMRFRSQGLAGVYKF